MQLIYCKRAKYQLFTLNKYITLDYTLKDKDERFNF